MTGSGRSAAALTAVPYDPELAEGARNAVFTCLAVRREERCVLITDESRLSIGAALAEQFAAASEHFTAFVLDDVAPRPLRGFPAEIAAAMEDAQVTCYAASAWRGELPARMEMTAIVDRRRIRHAH
ncbi:MAG: aminopeptidase, partial [Gemmatimonadetes bacterium]|nr:aminopeptidase [Gemmatimonadota bacterium]